MKLIRYINDETYNRFIGHEITLTELVTESYVKDREVYPTPFGSELEFVRAYKISIEIKENK